MLGSCPTRLSCGEESPNIPSPLAGSRVAGNARLATPINWCGEEVRTETPSIERYLGALNRSVAEHSVF